MCARNTCQPGAGPFLNLEWLAAGGAVTGPIATQVIGIGRVGVKFWDNRLGCYYLSQFYRLFRARCGKSAGSRATAGGFEGADPHPQGWAQPDGSRGSGLGGGVLMNGGANMCLCCGPHYRRCCAAEDASEQPLIHRHNAVPSGLEQSQHPLAVRKMQRPQGDKAIALIQKGLHPLYHAFISAP